MYLINICHEPERGIPLLMSGNAMPSHTGVTGLATHTSPEASTPEGR